MYYIEKFLVRILFYMLTSCHVQGLGNIPGRGPLLILSNHLSVADPPALGIFLPRKSVFMAKEELFRNKMFGYFVKNFGAFPVYRGRSSREALRKAEKVLKSGEVLIMFPEGKRSVSGELQPGLQGSALIAYHNKVPILPVSITGTEHIRGGMAWIWRRPTINIKVGKPFILPESGYSLSRDELAEYTDLIMKQIAALLPEKYRGSYSENNLCHQRS